MGKSSSPQPQQQTVTQTNLPEYARPYFENVVQRAQAESYRPYQAYDEARIAGFTPAQQEIQQQILGMGSPEQLAIGSGLAAAAGMKGLGTSYTPGTISAGNIKGGQASGASMQAAQTNFAPNLQAFQFGPTRDVTAGSVVTAPELQAAQTDFGDRSLEQFRMDAPDMFGQPQADQYMSPYMRSVLDVQKREAIRDAQRTQLAQDLGAARQGTYGGTRQLLATLDRERTLGQQLGDIEARGMQSAFENAQAQFERDRAAGMTVGQANLRAALEQQQLRTQTGLQAALANLSADQQSRVANQAAQLQAQGMNADNALRAAIANQGVDVTRAQQNLASQLSTQELGTKTGLEAALANMNARQQANVQNLSAQLQTQGLNAEQATRAAIANQQAQIQAQEASERSRQFGAQQEMAGISAALDASQKLANLGIGQQQADLQRLQAQGVAAGQEQALEQQELDLRYADFLRERDYPMEQLGYFSNILRGLPVGLASTQTAYAQPPGMAQQVLGAGLGGLSMANLIGRP